MATIKAITLSDADGAQKYPRTYTKLVQNGDGEILDNIMLTSAKILPFSSINTDLDVTLQMASIIRSGEPILYIQEHNVFAVERVVQGITKYYPAWRTSADPTESLKYNNGNGTVGYNAREDNVYIAATNDMYVIINGTVTLVTNIGTMLNIARTSLESQIAEVKANIDDLLSRVAALEEQLA